MTRGFAPLALALGLVGGSIPVVAQDTVRVVRSLGFEGNRAIDDYTLSIAIGTTNSSWFARAPLIRWLGLGEKRFFDPIEFRRDVLRLTLLYRQSGYLDVQVDTVVRRAGKNVSLTFRITEGPPVVVTRFEVTGLDSISGARGILADLPLRTGAPFNRFLFQASADTIVSRLRDEGRPGVEVFRSYAVDRAARTAELTLEVVPGRIARFGPVRVEGARRVDSSFVRQLLAAREGQLFAQRDLFQSQRKLYQTELFRLATVGVDSAGYGPDSALVPLVVNVVEGPSHRIRSGIGFATNDCLRAEAGWTDRNLLGTGRLLDLSARVSKVGVGRPFGFGLERSICSALRDDPIGSGLANYSLAGQVRQPRFFTPTLSAAWTLFAERRSEFRIYRREEIGGNAALRRETARLVPITLGYRLTLGRTEASEGVFCAFFNACTPDDTRRLKEKKLLGVASAGISWPRANNPLDPSRGYVAGLQLSHSSRATGSAPFQTFTRVSGEAAWYRPIGHGGAVATWHLRGGLIFSPRVSFDSASGSFIPPSERFYAGGPNDVRGYDLNEMGPLVYVLNRDTLTAQDSLDLAEGRLRPRFSATGGNTLAVAQFELRVPAPVWSRRLRVAAFVDLGLLSERDKPQFSDRSVRVTPGLGLRLATPLGPARFDVGYNRYDRQPGPLYLQKTDGTLELVRLDFQQRRPSRFSYHFSFGQPF